MAQVAFIGFFVLAGSYFLYRGRIDLLTLGFGSMLVYFSPAFVGWVTAPLDADGIYRQPIVPAVYAVMGLAAGILTLGTYAFDRLPHPAVQLRMPGETYAPSVFLGVAIVTGLISLQTVGPLYFCVDKNIVLAAIDRWYYYFAYAVPFAAACAWVLGQRIIAVAAIALLAFDIYVGFRSNTAISFLAIATLYGHQFFGGWRKSGTFLVILLAVAFGFLFVKQSLYTLKAHGDAVCQESLLPNQAGAPHAKSSVIVEGKLVTRGVAPIQKGKADKQVDKYLQSLTTFNPYLAAVTQAEPFITQSILNEVVRKGFRTGTGYIGSQILSGVPGGKTLFGIDEDDTPTFSELFRPVLFPSVKTFGLGDNPWAQAYAAGSFMGVAMLAVAFTLLLFALSYAYWLTTGALQAVIAVVGVWIAFYMHRNDLLIEIGIVKHIVYTAVICMSAAYLLGKIMSRRSLVQEQS
jgi:hypothetical protein